MTNYHQCTRKYFILAECINCVISWGDSEEQARHKYGHLLKNSLVNMKILVKTIEETKRR